MPRLLNNQFTDPALDPGVAPLVAPAAVTTEGDRIRAALAAGTYGNQPIQAVNATVAPGGVTPTVSDTEPTGRFGTSFFNQPSIWEQNQDPAQLRQNLQLDTLKTLAAQRKFDLESSRAEAPMKDALLQAQTDAAGAHDRFSQFQDAETLRHTAGFFNHLSNPNAPAPNSPNYAPYVMQGLIKNPRFADTAGGKDYLKRITETADAHTSVDDLKKQLPEGWTVKRIEVGGGKQSHLIAEPPGTAANIPKELAKYALTPAQFENPASVAVVDASGKGSNSGNFVQLTTVDSAGQPKKVVMPKAAYLGFGGALASESSGAVQTDLKALAQKALNDPNSSEAHRQAARKILSGQ